MSLDLMNATKEDLVKEVVSIRQAGIDAGGKIGQLQTAVDNLTGKFRELRAHADAQDTQVRPSGNDQEAFEKYTVPAELAAGRHSERGHVRYGLPEQGKPGREFVARKESGHAVRLLTEWDEMGNCWPGLLDDPEPVTQWQADLTRMVELKNLGRMALAKSRNGQLFDGATPKIDASIRRHLQRAPGWVKQVLADNAGEGGELVADEVMPTLQRTLTLPRNVTALFEEMPLMTGGSNIEPFMIAGAQPFEVGVPAAGDLDPADIQRSVPTTTNINRAPKTWGVVVPSNLDITEDSVIAHGPMVIQQLAEAMRDGKEDAWINGDTNGGDTGIDSWNPRSRWNTLGSNRDHRKSFIGLRAYSFDVSSAGSLGTESAVGLMAELPHLNTPHMVGELAIITSPEWIVLKLLTDPNLLTLDKVGNLATILRGQVGSVFGHPVVMSEFVDVQYNASGIFDNATKTKTGVLIVNRTRWKNGIRRGPRTAVEAVARQHVVYMSVTERWAPYTVGRGTEKSVTWQYNATAS